MVEQIQDALPGVGKEAANQHRRRDFDVLPLRYKAKPKKLRTLQFPAENLLAVIEAELDKKFYGVEFVETGGQCRSSPGWCKWNR